MSRVADHRAVLLTVSSTLLLALLLTACGGDAARSTAPAAGPSQAPSPRSTATEEPLACVPGVEPFRGPAAERFGAADVMAAYCRVAELSLEHAFTDLLVPDGGRTAADLAGVRGALTPAARRRWDADVAAYLRRGDPAAHARIDALTLVDVSDVPPGFRLADDPPASFGDEVGADAVAGLAGDRLRLEVPVRTGIVLERRGDATGRHLLLPVTKRLSVVLDRGATGEWLVDRWSAQWRRGRVELVFG